MKRISLIIVIVVSLSVLCQDVLAERAYVTDSFRISLRRGPSIENKILQFISSGLPVEILESQNGWSRVRALDDESGTIEGWVLTRYLIARQPWEMQVQTLKEENAGIKKKLAGIEGTWQEKFNRENVEYVRIKEAYEASEKTVQTLMMENAMLESSQMIKWFSVGALVLLSGLMIGLLVGRQQKKIRSKLYS